MIETLSWSPGSTAERIAPAAPPGELEVAAILPRQAKSVSDTGLDARLVAALALKTLHATGRAPLPLLAGKLRLSVSVLREVLASLTAEQQVEVAWCGESDIDVQYQLTAIGQRAALEALAECRYVGPAPVTLAAWRAMVERQSLRRPGASRPGAAELAAVLADDGLDAGQRDLLGAALHAQRALLLHGPSGSGKTTLARKLARLLPGAVAVPWAVLVGGRIVRLYDPACHPAPLPLPLARQQEERRSCDARWVICGRPLVHVGADACAATFELGHDAEHGLAWAPPQLQANNGILVIDDLGRQRMPAAELLNRWLGPLDGGPLRLAQGSQAESLPFDALLVFATDLAPASLFEPAMLRRIGYRVGLGALSEAGYRALLRRQCRLRGLDCPDTVLEHLARLHRQSGTPLLACYPQELLGRLSDFASLAGLEPHLSIAAVEQAWNSLCIGGAPASNPVAGTAS